MSENCIFCKIVRKEAAASIVYEDAQVIVFMDIRPVNEGHTLVISRQHYEGIFDTPEELVAYTHKIAKRIAIAAKKATNADGISIIQQNGRAANQDIFHLHAHVIPRFEGQKMLRFSELTVANREKLDAAASKIMHHLN
jgi:histidine triad (HIT) family protein